MTQAGGAGGMRAKPAQFGVWENERVGGAAAAPAETRLRPLQALWVAVFVTLAVSLLVPQLRPAWIQLREALIAAVVACVLAVLTLWRRWWRACCLSNRCGSLTHRSTRKPLPVRTWWTRSSSDAVRAPTAAVAAGSGATAVVTTPPPTMMKSPDVAARVYSSMLSPIASTTTLRFSSPAISTEDQLRSTFFVVVVVVVLWSIAHGDHFSDLLCTSPLTSPITTTMPSGIAGGVYQTAYRMGGAEDVGFRECEAAKTLLQRLGVELSMHTEWPYRMRRWLSSELVVSDEGRQRKRICVLTFVCACVG